MNIKNRIKKFGAGIMASLCAVSVIGNTVSYAANADITKENVAFPTADEVIAQAATLLGSPYGWGFKGYTGAYYQGSYSPLSLDTVRSQGVDCSGLIYYTLTHLGYSTSGFSWNNPVPVDTPHWLSVNDNCTVSYSGISSKIEVEKENIPYTERPYWECADGSTITAGSVVIADNLAGEDHSWIYMGEFDSRQEVVDYLLNIGVDASYINDRTVGDGSGEGGTHWRIESNGSQGCVINNRTDGKKATSMNMYAFRITQDKVKKSPNGTIRINKQSEDGQNGGRTFTVTGGGETYTLTTGADGTAILADIPVFDSSNAPITYAISEKDVPVRYVVPDEQKTTLYANETVEVTFENRLKKFNAEVTKKDSENGTAQGNASLAGAVYGLYRDGERVAQYTTDENGYFKTDEYPCGNYTLQELTPSQGYQLNDEIYSIGAEPENYKVEANAVEMSVDENVIKGNISIVKHSDNDENTVENLESGAEFEIFLKSSGSYDSANESERDRLVTDENGFAETKDMPYGTYTVHQTKTVNDAEYAADFDVNIIENGKTYEYILNDKPFTSYIQIIKADSETGRTIPYEGAGFQIYNADGEIVDLGTDTFYTNNEGCLITPETLTYGEYSLVEVQAPIGYVLDSTPVPFTVSADNAEEKIIKVTKNDTAQKGNVWTHVVSLRRDDAQKMGYDDLTAWRELVKRQIPNIAKQSKIKMENLKWYAAFHDKETNPHVHIVVYSTNEREGFLTKQGCEKIRSGFMNDIYTDELKHLYQQQTDVRDLLKKESAELMEKLKEDISNGSGADTAVIELIKKLHGQLRNTTGKKVYGYLKKDVKNTVDEIFFRLSQNDSIQKMYKLWCDMEQAKHDFYSSAKVKFPSMVDNEHFRSVKNMIIQAANEIHPELIVKENSEIISDTVNLSPPEDNLQIYSDAVHGLLVSMSFLLYDDYSKEQRQLQSKVDKKLKQAIRRKKHELGVKSEMEQSF